MGSGRVPDLDFGGFWIRKTGVRIATMGLRGLSSACPDVDTFQSKTLRGSGV